MSRIRRGDVFYIDKYRSNGSEQGAGRPAVVVSNDSCNTFSPVVEIVYLTTQPKNNMPTHVKVKSLTRASTALCEQITSVSKERIGSLWARVTDNEMRQIEATMLISLGIEACTSSVKCQSETTADNSATLMAERDLYKSLYEEILNRVLPDEKARGEQYGA